MVYAAQPREGTETSHKAESALVMTITGLCSSTPRGDGNLSSISRVWATRTMLGLCSSTPRGDGNSASVIDPMMSPIQVYAAQPREGTETQLKSLV